MVFSHPWERRVRANRCHADASSFFMAVAIFEASIKSSAKVCSLAKGRNVSKATQQIQCELFAFEEGHIVIQ